MAGMVLETNIVSILHAVNDQNKLYKKSLRTRSFAFLHHRPRYTPHT